MRADPPCLHGHVRHQPWPSKPCMAATSMCCFTVHVTAMSCGAVYRATTCMSWGVVHGATSVSLCDLVHCRAEQFMFQSWLSSTLWLFSALMMTTRFVLVLFSAQVDGEDSEVTRAKFFIRDEFLVSTCISIRAIRISIISTATSAK